MLNRNVNTRLKEAIQNKDLRQALLSDPRMFLKDIGISVGRSAPVPVAIEKDDVMFGIYRP